MVVVQAAGAADVSASMREPFADFQASVPGTAFLLDCIRKHAPSARFVYLSSAAVYGNPETMPVLESFPPQPLSPYGWHKLAAEMLCREYAGIFGVKTVILRLFSAYGPGLRRQVIWDICYKLRHSNQVTLHGTGGETRDFLHVDDIARALAVVATSDLESGVSLNLASGSSIEIGALADLLRKRLSPHAAISFSGQCLPGYPSRWSADVSKLSALGFAPQVKIGHGLDGYVEWFRSTK
jgi:UDP-glucose 4-epimerase